MTLRGWTAPDLDAELDFATWSGNGAMLGVEKALGFVEEARFPAGQAGRR